MVIKSIRKLQLANNFCGYPKKSILDFFLLKSEFIKKIHQI